MTPLSPAERERWEDLKTAQLLFGLEADEQAEFDALSVRVPADQAAALDHVVAALDVAWTDPQAEPLPETLRESLLMRAKDELPRRLADSSVDLANRAFRGRAWDYAPWVVAAASLAFAALMTFSRPADPGTPDLARQRSELIASATDLVQAEWTAGPTPIAGASGDVVWSPQRQQGFMRFRGLTSNDPTREQYQLWIFDKNQSDKTPIDGGVFDVPAGAEVIVPIDPKLRVQEAYLFAVTTEKPGGVVVSSRERLPLLAKLK